MGLAFLFLPCDDYDAMPPKYRMEERDVPKPRVPGTMVVKFKKQRGFVPVTSKCYRALACYWGDRKTTGIAQATINPATSL